MNHFALPLHRKTFAEVDTRRIRSNFQAVKSLLPDGTFICPMVKANAYGHGDIEVSRALRKAGAPHLGVGLIEEGIGLRSSGDEGSLLMFGLFEKTSAEAILEYDLTPVISEWHQLESLQEVLKSDRDQSVKIHLKFNTGMNRLGFDVSQGAKIRSWLNDHRQFHLEGVCTHLLRGDDAGAPGGESESQLLAFAEALSSFKDLPIQAHALNSSGTVNLWHRVLEKKALGPGAKWPLGSRPGLAIYGVPPSSDEKVRLPLQPALSLKSHLVMLHRLKPGERVSYNATWRAKRDSLIGVVPIGYGDGYFRMLSNKASVLCKGVRAPVAGTICMDYFMVDLTEVEAKTGPVHVGEQVVLIGEQGGDRIQAQELSDLIGTIPYEVLTNISERVPRVYLK